MTGRRRAGRSDKSAPPTPPTPQQTPPTARPTPQQPSAAQRTSVASPPAQKPVALGAVNITPAKGRGQRQKPKGKDKDRPKDMPKAPPAPSRRRASPPPKALEPTAPLRQLSGSRATRRAVREQEHKNRRRRTLTVIAVVVLVALVGGLIFWLQGRNDNQVVAPTPTGRSAKSLTLTLAAPGEDATSGVLLVSDTTAGTASGVLIPSHVYVTGPTSEGIPFGRTVQLASHAAPGEALANTLNVLVDNTWQLSTDELAALVNAVGGIAVDVDTNIIVDHNGTQQVVIAAGDGQTLNGAQAVQFAQYRAKGEPEEVRLARYRQVVEQLIRRMPDSADQITTLLEQNKATQTLTQTPAELADFLVAFGDVARSGDAEFESLPTKPLGSVGHGIEATTPDDDAVAELRQNELAGIVPPNIGGEQIAVLVQNGVGTQGIEQDAAKQLTNAGFTFVNGGDANKTNYAKSLVVIPDTTDPSVAVGYKVAETLGLPKSAVRVSNLGSNVADVIVILGKDYKP